MTDLDLIKSSPSLQVELSELLFEKLGMGCWHKWVLKEIMSPYIYSCKKCKLKSNHSDNPNLFHDGNSFFMVWEAVKDREDWQEEFIDMGLLTFEPGYINTPLFQYLTLEWLLEKDGELGRLEEIMEKGRGE